MAPCLLPVSPSLRLSAHRSCGYLHKTSNFFLNFRHESGGMGDSLGRSRDSEETREHTRDDRVYKHGHNILNTCMNLPNM